MCGLTLRADTQLPELQMLAEREPEPEPERIDVRIRFGDGAPSEATSHRGREARFSTPGVGRYLVRHGSVITVWPVRGAEAWAVRAHVLGAAWGALLHQRGAFALHAGVTEHRGGAWAFCGPPGAGKSSTVIWLLGRGHRLVSDDLTRMELTPDGPPRVWPSIPRLKLTPAALQAQGWPPGVHVTMGDEKVHLPWRGARSAGPVPLCAVFILAWGKPGLRRLRGTEALRRLAAAATYRPELFESETQLAEQWQRALGVVRRVPVWELTRSDWTSMEQVMGSVQELAADSR